MLSDDVVDEVLRVVGSTSPASRLMTISTSPTASRQRRA